MSCATPSERRTGVQVVTSVASRRQRAPVALVLTWAGLLGGGDCATCCLALCRAQAAAASQRCASVWPTGTTYRFLLRQKERIYTDQLRRVRVGQQEAGLAT